VGEQIANLVEFTPMSDEPLSRADVEAFQRQLSMLSEPAVREQYIQSHARMLSRKRLTTDALRDSEIPERVESSLAVATKWEKSVSHLNHLVEFELGRIPSGSFESDTLGEF